MNDELRETIGKAAYSVLQRDLHHPNAWNELAPEKQEINNKAAEAAVEAYLQHIRLERGEHFDKKEGKSV